MSTMNSYFTQAELALAAYANLMQGMSKEEYIRALQQDGGGLSLIQAQNFASRYTVVDQYDGMVEETYYDEFGDERTVLVSTGLSVTLFQEISTNKQVVAIRGTQDVADWMTNIIDIGLLGTAEHQAQYAALSAKVQQWLEGGVLQSGFTVAGHSLGGFLATNLALEYAADATHTYIYNAPGVAGVTGGLIEAITKALSPDKQFILTAELSISNIVATWDPVSTVGLSIAPPVPIQIEANINPVHNHSIRTLTDALAVQSLLGALSVTADAGDVNEILSASTHQTAMTLESVVNALGELFQAGTELTGTEDDVRNALYTRIQAIRNSAGYRSAVQSADSSQLVSLAEMFTAEIAELAENDVAYRYALLKLNAFAVSGVDYSRHNTNGQLELYNPKTGTGSMSENYLADRSAMLAGVIRARIADVGSGNVLIDGSGSAAGLVIIYK